MASTFSLTKKERLKSRKQIDQLFAGGESFGVFPLRVYYIARPITDEICVQAGFSVSKKYFKRSVHRNRIKRLLREAYRLQKQSLCHTASTSGKKLHVFIIYTGKELPPYSLIAKKMHVVLEKLIEKIVQPNS